MTGSLIRLALAISRGDNKRDKGTVRERDWSGVIPMDTCGGRPVLNDEANSVSRSSETNFMKRPKPKRAVAEVECSACEGTGFQPVKQPAQPGRKIFPARCQQCSGKGRLELPRP